MTKHGEVTIVPLFAFVLLMTVSPAEGEAPLCCKVRSLIPFGFQNKIQIEVGKEFETYPSGIAQHMGEQRSCLGPRDDATRERPPDNHQKTLYEVNSGRGRR